ncbi:MAG: GNAT family N-acetyltransferase [Anaerolineales bacterium]
MAALNTPVLAQTPQLRPLNILRDLPAVADLVETCFAATLDSDGRRYIQQMRKAGSDNVFLRWAMTAVETVSMPLSGYVWEENGEIIGNVSLIPYRGGGKRIYLIANVAVRPDYRRRGIGRALTVAAMHHARQKRADEIWLHVREDNPGAIALYLSLGFCERARRTTWQAVPDRGACLDGLGLTVEGRSLRDWNRQQAWLRQAYPEHLTWYQSMPWLSLRPGLLPSFYRAFLDFETRHWAAHAGEHLLAALTWQAGTGNCDRLWLAAPAEGNDRAVTALLLHARRQLAWRQKLSLEYPADVHAASIEASGFQPQRTLLWMQWSETSFPSIT